MSPAAIVLVVAHVVGAEDPSNNTALRSEAERAFERGEAGAARILVDTVLEREGTRATAETVYWRRLLAVSGCEKWDSAAPRALALRLLDLEEARGRRFRAGAPSDGTVWATWLADSGLRWRHDAHSVSAHTWRHEKEIWPDERHVSDRVRSRCRALFSDTTTPGAPAPDDETIARELLGTVTEPALRERLLQLLVSRFLATDRQDEVRRWLQGPAPINPELRLARLALASSNPRDEDLRLLAAVARTPSHGAHVAAQARHLAALASARRWNDVASSIATTPDAEPLHAYRDYLSVALLDRTTNGRGDTAVFARVQQVNARRRWFGPYRLAVDAILIRRTADRIRSVKPASNGAVRPLLAPLLASVAPIRHATVIDAVHQRLVLEGDARSACALVAPLRDLSPSLGARREIECAILLGEPQSLRTLALSFAEEEPERAAREVFGTLPALIAATTLRAELAAALLGVVERLARDADGSERTHWKAVATTLRGLTLTTTIDAIAIGRIVVNRDPLPLLPPPAIRFTIPEPEHFLWHRLYPKMKR